MKGMLLTWLPESLFALVLVGVGFALILGVISRQRAFGIVGSLVLFLLISPFIYALFDKLPVWMILAVFVVVILSAFRAILGFCFGKGSTDQFVGQVMFAAFSMPFRLLGRLFQRTRRF